MKQMQRCVIENEPCSPRVSITINFDDFEENHWIVEVTSQSPKIFESFSKALECYVDAIRRFTTPTLTESFELE